MTLSKEEFKSKFKGRMLVMLADAWACRKAGATELGFLMDQHTLQLKQLMDDMYAALVPDPVPFTNNVARKDKTQ